MIEKLGTDDFGLFCDNCGDECDQAFYSFYDAVDYRQDEDNGWRTIKDSHGDFCDLCPACNTPDVIRKLKGVGPDEGPRDETDAAEKALKALEGL
jgi:hypothetical protein